MRTKHTKYNHMSNIVRNKNKKKLSAYKKNSVNKVQSICKIKRKKREKNTHKTIIAQSIFFFNHLFPDNQNLKTHFISACFPICSTIQYSYLFI